MPDRLPLDVIKPEVRKLSAYTLEHVKADVKLDQNENPYELPDALKREIVERVLARPWGRYPEFVPTATTAALAKFTGWPAEGILIGNGSNELIEATLLVTAGPGKTVAIPQPTFTLYRLMSSVLQAQVVPVPLRGDLSFDVPALCEAARTADVVVICSPNNPTGSSLEPDGLAEILESARGMVIVDEAYHEFSRQTAMGLLKRYRNMVLLRTFSKAMSMAALRFGYLMTQPEIAKEIYKAKLPYNVNVLTLAAAETVVANRSVLDDAINRLIAERERVMKELRKRVGVEAFPSSANFILIRTGRPARTLFDAMYAQGVLVRDVSGYPMLDRALRVSIGKPEENDRFLKALDEALSAGG